MDMRELPEADGKDLLNGTGIEIPDGQHVFDPDAPIRISPPAVVKAQIPVSGRGKKGGIIFANSSKEIDAAVTKLLGSSIDGQCVESVLVEEQFDVNEEFYVAFTADGSDRFPKLVISLEGGRDIESVSDDHVSSHRINPLIGAQQFHVRTILDRLHAGDVLSEHLPFIVANLWECFRTYDLRLLELNPLCIHDGAPVALDTKIVVDDAATFRQEFNNLHSTLSKLEETANEENIDLRVGPGRVGLVTNTAGVGLTTIDLLAEKIDEGVAGFIDTHGTEFHPDDMTRYLFYLERCGAEAVFFTISAPALDCEIVAEAITNARADGYTLPMVARLKGRNAEEAARICADAGVTTTTDLEDGVNKIATLLGGEN